MSDNKIQETQEEIDGLYSVLEKIKELDEVVGLSENTVKDVIDRVVERISKLEQKNLITIKK